MGKSFKSKRLQGQQCAYCGGSAETWDHVLARAFFPKAHWPGLPEVPACLVCNNSKSGLENYLATVLLFGGRHADALSRLLEMGKRRLEGNLALHRKLIHGKSRVWVSTDSAIAVKTMALPIDAEKFTRYFELVVKGLTFYEFGVTVGEDDHLEIATATEAAGVSIFRKMLSLTAANRVHRNFGNGTFFYEGAQGVDNPHITVWLITAFGGLVFQDEDGRNYESQIGALTGPRHIAERVELRQKWIDGRGNFT